MINIAIITARGGSKRIPHKNIKYFCGDPIISYPIRSALDSGIFDEVMVSTDDAEIAEISKNYGAKVPFMRSNNTSNDFATTTDVILEVLEMYKTHGKKFDYFCCIYPTSPFISAEKLQLAYQILKQPNANAVVPVVPFSFPPMRGMIIEQNLLKMKYEENLFVRSQDLELMYHDSGQFYFCNTDAFQKEKTVFLSNTRPLILTEMEVQDIDNEIDWNLAELKYQLLYGRDNK